MGAMHVHEFMTLDGVIDAPTWTFEYEFLPEMEKSIGAVTKRCRGILLGRTTYEMFARDARASVVDANRGGRSSGAVLQRHHQVRRLFDGHDCDVQELENYRAG